MRRPHANVNVMQTQLNSKVAHRKLFTISAAATIVDVDVDVDFGVAVCFGVGIVVSSAAV